MKIKKIDIWCYLILLVNIPPAFFTRISIIDEIYSILQIFCFIICIILFFINLKNNHLSTILLFIVLFWAVYIFSTIINKGSIITSIRPLLMTFSICSFYELYIKTSKKYDIIKDAKNYFAVLLYINLITILIFPEGLYYANNENAHYFLGHKNNSIEYIIPAVCFSLIYDEIKKRKVSINSKVLIACSLITVILTWSANAIIATTFMFVTLFLQTKNIIEKIINCTNFFIAYIASFFLIIIFRMQYIFAWLIEDILHKSLDFTYRTYIWDKALKWISESPVIGYGFEDPGLKVLKIGHPNSAHNYILDYLYMGGYLGLSIIGIILILIVNKLNKIKNNFSKILTYSVCTYFILWFATPIHRDTLCLMFLIFTMSYYVSKLSKEGSKLHE